MLDAGDRTCAMEASSHASELHRLDRVRFAALVFTNLTQDHLDFHGDDGVVLRRRSGGCSSTAAARRGQRRRRVRTPARARSCPDALTFGLADDAEVGPSALDGIDLQLRGRFNVENALGALAAARLLGIDDDAIARGLESVRGVPGPVRGGRRGAAVHGDRRLRAHARRARERAARGARARDGSRVICVVRLRRRPRPRQAAADGPRRLRARRRRRSSPPTIPRSEDPHAIIAEIVAGAVGDVERRARPRGARSRVRVELRATETSCSIAGKGARAGPGVRRPHDPVRRPRGRARRAARAGSRDVIPLSLDELRSLGLGTARRRRRTRHRRRDRLAARRSPAISSSPSAAASRSSTMRARAARLRRSCPTTPSPRSPRSARRARARSNARVVAITGSVGKTSTKDILAALCRPHARTVAAEGGYNNEIGLPLTLLPHRARHGGRASRRWACAGSARSPSSARSRGRTSA